LVNLPRIAVLIHDHDDFQGGGYLLRRLCDEWERQGAQVFVVRVTQTPWPEAELAILHADITAVGDEYRAILAHYPRVINGRVTDVSKRVVSQLVLARDDEYAGPVIVKTNANFGGLRELPLAQLMSKPAPASWQQVTWLTDYPVFDRLSKVPGGVWQNPRLVVEKFLPELNDAPRGVNDGAEHTTSDQEYVLRVWVFLGNQSIHYRCISKSPVIKGRNTLRRELLSVDTVPAELRDRRAELGFEYGKFDYALVGGRSVLYDANRTPGTPGNKAEQSWGQPGHEASQERIRRLSEGLQDFLGATEGRPS
jgi:hypothetical protein